MLKKKIGSIFNVGFIVLMTVTQAWASTPMEASTDFSEQMLELVKGPILKVLAAAVLLVGIAGLLRGRHKLAVSCGLAFLLLLFLPILLEHV